MRSLFLSANGESSANATEYTLWKGIPDGEGVMVPGYFSGFRSFSCGDAAEKLEMLGNIVSCLASPTKILGEKKFG